MKKFFVSTGLAAIGLASIQSGLGAGLDIVSPKAWSISGTLRGFYDDNYNISSTRKGSWGGEVSPTVSYNLPLRQTDMGMRYTYVLYYYNDRDQLGINPFDQSHQFDFWLTHAINERWKINFTDTFTYGNSPELATPATSLGTAATIYRTQSDNIANHANISLDTQWTKLFGTSLHYGNDFYNFENSGTTAALGGTASTIIPQPYNVGGLGFMQLVDNKGNPTSASLAGLLDRVEQNMGLDFNWTLSPETTLSAGADFTMVNYTGNEPIAVYNYFDPTITSRSLVYNSNARDSRAYSGHVGVSHDLTANLHLSMVVGAAYTDSYNDPLNHTTSVSPVANVSVNYTYLPGSYVQLGVTQGHNATDVAQPGLNGQLTQYQDTTTVFADLNHKLTDKLTGTVVGQYSYSSYEGGAAQSTSDSGISAGVNLSYQINHNFSADAGYNFDDLFSGIASRGFVRNRVYMGMTASY